MVALLSLLCLRLSVWVLTLCLLAISDASAMASNSQQWPARTSISWTQAKKTTPMAATIMVDPETKLELVYCNIYGLLEYVW